MGISRRVLRTLEILGCANRRPTQAWRANHLFCASESIGTLFYGERMMVGSVCTAGPPEFGDWWGRRAVLWMRLLPSCFGPGQADRHSSSP